jgi:hypothetical protein
MICFLVNRIVEIDNVTHGIAMENELVIHNFGLVYGLEKAKNLLLSIQSRFRFFIKVN